MTAISGTGRGGQGDQGAGASPDRGEVPPTEGTSASGQDRIIISDLLVRGILGLTPLERESPQDILINIVLYADLRAVGASDDPSGILNYRSVAKDVIRYVESSRHYLVEALATAVARICVLDHGARRVVVRVEKPGALRYARSVGVEIERSAADFDAGAGAAPDGAGRGS